MTNEIVECAHNVCKSCHRTIRVSKAAQFKQYFLVTSQWCRRPGNEAKTFSAGCMVI